MSTGRVIDLTEVDQGDLSEHVIIFHTHSYCICA